MLVSTWLSPHVGYVIANVSSLPWYEEKLIHWYHHKNMVAEQISQFTWQNIHPIYHDEKWQKKMACYLPTFHHYSMINWRSFGQNRVGSMATAVMSSSNDDDQQPTFEFTCRVYNQFPVMVDSLIGNQLDVARYIRNFWGAPSLYMVVWFAACTNWYLLESTIPLRDNFFM